VVPKRRALVAALVGGILAATLVAGVSQAQQATNLFSGNWNTSSHSAGFTNGTVAFEVISQSDGTKLINSLGGTPCGPGSTYYRGTYTDPANPDGLIGGCTTAADHMVGRFEGDDPSGQLSPGAEGDLDILITSPGNFQGTFTYHGSQYDYNGTFFNHFIGDGCCPSSGGGTTSTSTNTPPPVMNTTPTNTPGAAAGDCAASAASLRITVTKRNAKCRLKGKKPQPAVLSPEKSAASTQANKNLTTLFIYCLVLDPHKLTDMCQFINEIADYLQAVFDDPPSASFMHAAVIVAPVRITNNNVSVFCPRGCPGAVGAINAFDAQLGRLEAAVGGLANAADRYSGAKLAGSAGGIRIQAALGQAYAGEVADLVTVVTSRVRVLVTALTRAGNVTTLTSVQIETMRTQLQTNGLPATYARALPNGGAPATTLASNLVSASANPPATVSLAQILPPQLAPAPFRAASHTITLPEVGGLVDALRSQNALSKRAYGLLHSDLLKLNKAPNQAAENKALARLKNDLNGLSRSTKPATETLLQHAVAGL
jgi:hypothetical protein